MIAERDGNAGVEDDPSDSTLTHVVQGGLVH